MNIQSPCNGQPASVCKRRDDQSSCGSHVLVTIVHACIDLADLDIIVSCGLAGAAVVSELLLPFKVVDVVDEV